MIQHFPREMQAQGELLRKEMQAQEARQRSAIDDLMQAIDVRAQVAELGEDVRYILKKQDLCKSMTLPKIGVSRTPQSAMCVPSNNFGRR